MTTLLLTNISDPGIITAAGDVPAANILLVDDAPETVLLLARRLKDGGHVVRQALDGEEALRSARQRPPDLILLDIDMPGLSGYEVALRLKEDHLLSEIPIIFLSSLNGTEDKLRAFESGGVDYVTKPFQFAEVESRVHTHLKISRLQKDLAQRNREVEAANKELRRLETLRDNLAAASKFGMWWTYYQQFDFQSVEAECRRSALDFLHVFDQFIAADAKLAAILAKRSVVETARHLRAWANESSAHPPAGGSLSLTKVLLFLTIYRTYIESLLNAACFDTDQIVHPDVGRRLESYLKWRGHFPRIKTKANLQEIMEQACQSNTIVVVGDIRRSQDLMTYAVDQQDFTRRMVEFISQTRLILDKHGGFFDKYTGDGFIGYFNESICAVSGSNYVDRFVNFMGEFTRFCNSHFRQWVKFLRKIPGQTAGMAIGADLGRVSFQSLNYHVIAVGESIVWASRMSAAARAEEALVNNLLHQLLCERGDLTFEGRESNTKSGEGFKAWQLFIKDGSALPLKG